MAYKDAKWSWHYISGPLTLDSSLLPQGRRQGDSRCHQRLVRLPQHLTAQHKALALKQGLDFLEIIQTAQDLRPLPGFAFFLQALLERAPEEQRQETAEHVAANRLVALARLYLLTRFGS